MYVLMVYFYLLQYRQEDIMSDAVHHSVLSLRQGNADDLCQALCSVPHGTLLFTRIAYAVLVVYGVSCTHQLGICYGGSRALLKC